MSIFRRLLAVLLIVSITGAGLPYPAQAAMLTTDATLAAGARDRIDGFLQRDNVRALLEVSGVDCYDVKARVAALSDEEAAELAKRIDTLPAGGDAGSALIGAALVVFLVLLLTDILGLTRVFSFTRPIKR
jgi:hypothetical protein